MVSDHEQRLSALEKWQDQVNQNIESLQQLLNTTDYITSVTPLVEGGEEVGYTITFLNSDPINIYHGKKGDTGDDGYTPQISLTQGTDGNWYWTLDGELMLDKDNNPIRANGEDGQEGQQGQQGQTGQTGASAPTPQIKLGSNIDSGTIATDGGTLQPAAWYLSVDGGQTWYRITGDKGEPSDEGDEGPTGESFFQDVTVHDGYVEFTLSDGISFTVQKFQSSLTFLLGGTELEDLTQAIDLVDGELTYSPATAQVSARVLEGEGWSASAESGAITVSPGSMNEEATLEVTLLDNGRVIETYRLTVTQTGLRGEGTEESPYTVSSPAELAYIAEQVNNSAYSDYPYLRKYIELTQDIDLTGMEWTPIGLDDLVEYLPAFCGTFDGNNHTIKGMSITEDGTESTAVGLFGLVNSGTIKNVILESPTITAGRRETGFIVGSLQFGNIENCRVIDGTMNCVGSLHVGGIVGYLNNGSGINSHVLNCHVENTAINSEVSEGGVTGGIVAFVAMGNTVSVTACSFEGTITSQKKETGGIVAVSYLNNGTNGNLEITGCYSSGTILSSEGSLIGTGGIIGHIYAGNTMVKASYSTMNITSQKTSGGVIGCYSPENTDPDVFADACYWSGTGPEHGIGRIYRNGGTQSPDSEKEGATDENATKVTGSDWSAAKAAMNAALSGTDWLYVDNTDAATQSGFPLVIAPQGN